MNIFVVEKYLVLVKNIRTEIITTYSLEKYSNGIVATKQINNNIEIITKLDDIKEKELFKVLSQLQEQIKRRNIRYAEKYILSFLKDGEVLDIGEYADKEELQSINTDNYQIKVVRSFYNAKGKMYEKIFNTKWKK